MNTSAERLKQLLLESNSPIFIINCEIPNSGSGRKVKYVIPRGTHGPDAIEDITQRVARAMEVDHRVDNLGRLHINGGDGSDLINSLSIDLFGSHTAINVFTLR